MDTDADDVWKDPHNISRAEHEMIRKHGWDSPEADRIAHRHGLRMLLRRVEILRIALLSWKIHRELNEEYALTRDQIAFFYLFIRVWNRHQVARTLGQKSETLHSRKRVYEAVAQEARVIEREFNLSLFLTKSYPYYVSKKGTSQRSNKTLQREDGFIIVCEKKKLIVKKPCNILSGEVIGSIADSAEPEERASVYANIFDSTMTVFGNKRHDEVPAAISTDMSEYEAAREELYQYIRGIKRRKAWLEEEYAPRYEKKNIFERGGFPLSHSEELFDTELHRIPIYDLQQCLHYILLSRFNDEEIGKGHSEDIAALQVRAQSALEEDLGIRLSDLFRVFDSDMLKSLSFLNTTVDLKAVVAEIEQEKNDG